jgi:hypothetical protein
LPGGCCQWKERFVPLNGIQSLTATRLEQLTLRDLQSLATFAQRRLQGIPESFISAEDVVQKTLLHVIGGAQESTPRRRPTRHQVQSKATFMKYMTSAIGTVIARAERKRALLPIHEPLPLVNGGSEGEPVSSLEANISPEDSASLQDLKTEIFSRLRRYAPPRLLPTINEWERTFFWTNQMPRQGSRSRRIQVRMLAMQVLKEIDENLAG